MEEPVVGLLRKVYLHLASLSKCQEFIYHFLPRESWVIWGLPSLLAALVLYDLQCSPSAFTGVEFVSRVLPYQVEL